MSRRLGDHKPHFRQALTGWPDLSGAMCNTNRGRDIMDAARETTGNGQLRRIESAKLICSTCPLRESACLEVLQMENPAGSWGGVMAGLSSRERREAAWRR